MRNHHLIDFDRWDLSKIFYDTRTILDRQGYDTSIMNAPERRKVIHNAVADICEDLGLKRHEIGIFAADRAQMAFNGQIYNVNYENFESLAELGTDIIFTEKEGLVNTLVPFTTNIGIALVQSGGWSSEYTKMLIERTQELPFKNIATLTDFDSQGVGIALEYPGIIRLGVDLQTVSDLGVSLADVEEHIEPLKFNKKSKKMEENSHWVSLKNKMTELRTNLIELNNSSNADVTPDEREELYKLVDVINADNLIYLRSNRIELGAITAAVGPQRFWAWLRKKILKAFPNRDYNRAIYVPETVMPQVYLDFDAALKNKIKSVLKPSYHGWKDTLGNYEGFINSTGDKYDEIENDMRDNHLMMDNTIRQLMKDINKLKQKYLN
jgi:hypothetical protein